MRQKKNESWDTTQQKRAVCTLPVHIQLLLDNPRRIIPHPLLKHQMLDDTLWLGRRCNPTFGQGLNGLEARKHIYIKKIAKTYMTEVTLGSADTDDAHRRRLLNQAPPIGRGAPSRMKSP
jgi:hypothetical protein